MTTSPARGLLDTSVFIASESGRPLDESALPEFAVLSVITLGELWAGVLAAADGSARAQRMRTATAAARLTAIPVDASVAQAWAELRVALEDLGRTLRSNDSWIAATAIALGIPLVTQDGDFDGVPGLSVIRV